MAMPRIKEEIPVRTFRVSDSLWEKFSEQAAGEHHTASSLLRKMMAERIKRGERRERQEREAA